MKVFCSRGSGLHLGRPRFGSGCGACGSGSGAERFLELALSLGLNRAWSGGWVSVGCPVYPRLLPLRGMMINWLTLMNHHFSQVAYFQTKPIQHRKPFVLATLISYCFASELEAFRCSTMCNNVHRAEAWWTGYLKKWSTDQRDPQIWDQYETCQDIHFRGLMQCPPSQRLLKNCALVEDAQIWRMSSSEIPKIIMASP